MNAFQWYRRTICAVMVSMGSLHAGPRDTEWQKVADAWEKGQPKTAMELLAGLEKAAFAEQAWGEGARALAARIAAEARIEGQAPAVKKLEAELAQAPEAVRPLLRALAARWMEGYYQSNRWRFMSRSQTGTPVGNDMETWDLPRILKEVDSRLQRSLAEAETLKKVPVADFAELLEKGELEDSFRPTMYDFLAHTALEFYSAEEVAASHPQDDFAIAVDSPAFGTMEEFLAWKPQVADETSPKYRALRIFQQLLEFHRADADRGALLLADLERLQWANGAAAGEGKDARYEKALRAYIEANQAHALSAWARVSLGDALVARDETKEAHAVYQAGARAFPQHPFGKLCANGVAQLEMRDLTITTESQWTPAGEPIQVQHRNLKKVWFRLYAADFTPGRGTADSDPIPDGEASLAKLVKGEAKRAWSEELPDDGDYRSRKTRLEAPKDLPAGYYLLVASADEAFSTKDNQLAVAGIHATSLALTSSVRGGDGIEGAVVDAVTGAPLPEIEVALWIQGDVLLRKQSAKTDAQGIFRFPKSREGGRRLVIASRGAERAVLRVWGGGGGFPTQKGSTLAVFFTDRSIYRPGQTVHFKGILCRIDQGKGQYQALPNEKGTVQLVDPNGKEAARLEVVTNERGSFSGTFTAPEGSVLGTCRISLLGNSGGIGIRVEEYKRPKFVATVEAPQEPAALGKTVKVTVKAEAYTGAPVDGAKVAWRVTRMTRFPDWLGWCWWYRPIAPSENLEIAHGVAETDASGAAVISFEAKPDLSVTQDVEPVFDFLVNADVTDSAGETRTGSRSVSVAYTSLKASLSGAEWLETGKEAEFKVRTESHDGEGRAAKGVLKIHRLKEPEVCPRPDNLAGWSGIDPLEKIVPQSSPDPDKWEPGEVVAELPVETGKDGAATLKKALPAGAYRLVFETKDEGGRVVKALRGIEVVDPAATVFPTHMPFFIGAPSWSVEAGNVLTFVWGSGHPKARACVEWYQDGRLLKRQWSDEGRTQQTFTFAIDEKQRGGISLAVRQVTLNRMHQFSRTVDVPWTNKELKLHWEHLVSKLEPGSKESWTAVIEGPGGEAVAAEMVATLYDASLDAFAPHAFRSLSYLLRREPGYYANWDFSSDPRSLAQEVSFPSIEFFSLGQPFRDYRADLRLYGNSGGTRFGRGRGLAMLGGAARHGSTDLFFSDAMPKAAAAPASPAPIEMESAVTAGLRSGDGAIDRRNVDAVLNNPNQARPDGAPQPDVNQVTARANLQETAFFFPDLTSGDDGKVRMTFTMPEALTKWRFLGLAHDKDLRAGLLEGETVTAKDLMVQPNPPRFLREGDKVWFTVKVTNQSDQPQSGKARLGLTDAATDEEKGAALGVTAAEQDFTVPAKESRTLKWLLTVPDGAGFLRYKAVATSGKLSDGEEGWLPVIPRRILVTESLALPIRDAGTKDFDFEKLLKSGGSDTLESRFVHVQVVSQPAWYAVMALPYLMEFPHECAEQTFSRYYANALARNIANSDPKMRRIFDQWKAAGKPLDSPLTKNADLNGILLEETPWLREANNESEARRRVGLLFEANHMDRELEKALAKLVAMQRPDGLWPWFPGGPGDPYITLHIVTGFARLRALGVETDITPAMKALGALDHQLAERYEEIRKAKRLGENNLDPWVAHHLYTRTFFLKDKALQGEDKTAFDYFADQGRKFWNKLGGRMSQAHLALALGRLGDTEVPKLVTRSLKEHAVVNEEQGMYWKDGEGEGWWWWRAPIETQAMMIEAFREIDKDEKAVDDCQVWLIKQKQVQDWKTTKATADAVYALLKGGWKNRLASNALLQISLGGTEVKPENVEAGTGFYENRFVGAAVKPELGKIELKKTDEGVAWASVHWQYLEDMAKVTSHEGAEMKLEKSLWIRRNTDKGPVLEPVNGPVKVGDELVTRVVLKNDRAMEYVHLKDLRGSGTEPVNVLSGYRWQDGFGYYEVTRDTASHFFIDRLPPGTHVFETSVRVQHAGDYQTGIAEIRCMYAPEFNAHSASVEIKAE